MPVLLTWFFDILCRIDMDALYLVQLLTSCPLDACTEKKLCQQPNAGCLRAIVWLLHEDSSSLRWR